MLLLAGLMGVMAVGATALWAFDETDDDERWDVPLPGQDDMASLEAANAGPSPIDIATAPDSAEEDDYAVQSGTDQGEALTGEAGPDMLNGYGGDDSVAGAGGHDELRGGDGDDSVDGGEGNDTLRGDAGQDTLGGDDGDDLLFGHEGDDSLDGGEGNDTLMGGEGGDSLDGGEGDDALHGYLGNDSLNGGPGSDSLFGGEGDDMLNGLDPEGTAPGGDVDYLHGGAGDDQIVAGQGAIVTTGEGADMVTLGSWLDADHQAEVMDFSTLEDSLVILYDDTSGAEPDVAVEQDENDQTLHHVLVNGERIAAVHSMNGLGLEHITLLPQAAP